MKEILLLHGSRQTGQLLLGRMGKLCKRLQKEGFTIVAPDGLFPHPDDPEMLNWWNRDGNFYNGLEESVKLISNVWKEGNFVGILGFSQGARFCHLLLTCHQHAPERFIPGVRFGIMVAGYDAVLPPNLSSFCNLALLNEESLPTSPITVPSMHVIGDSDRLILPESSRAVAEKYYQYPILHQHEGGHHVPMRAASVQVFVEFITDAAEENDMSENNMQVPDEETALLQEDEVEALQAIFMDEFTLLSKTNPDGEMEYPISYQVALLPTNGDDDGRGWWPPHPVSLQFKYPHNYPHEAMPLIQLVHENNVLELSSAQKDECLRAMRQAWENEQGMPCVMSCVYAARNFFEEGAVVSDRPTEYTINDQDGNTDDDGEESSDDSSVEDVLAHGSAPKACSEERLQACIEEGLRIAERIMEEGGARQNGGAFKLTLGLVEKPSAGKSTFFNVATAFARQRGDGESTLGGATMAPHPFTTVDPNVGYCLVPAPPGSCPEEIFSHSEGEAPIVACTHGRDAQGRRLLPVLLKDVAGLVPGAYQGRGRGNKFLSDLTDANVLIHILDASGIADEGGNTVGTEEDGSPCESASHPLSDLAWIRKELIEWVYTNLLTRWDTICRKGRSKLSGMFSGYGQPEGVTSRVLYGIEKFAEVALHCDRFLDNLLSWDSGDIYRLVSAFLAVRFPVVLALNKKDLPMSARHIADIQAALPTHGAHTGIPLSANSEMDYMRCHITKVLGLSNGESSVQLDSQPPYGVWNTLQHAISLADPIIMFPVSDLKTLAPMSGLTKSATEDPSLPSIGMNACVTAAGGTIPSHWDPKLQIYSTITSKTSLVLRDAIVMKPGSTVENLFLTLKRLGALSGEFIRAEGMRDIGQSPKPIPKHQVLSKNIRIVRIMTNKRSAWQK